MAEGWPKKRRLLGTRVRRLDGPDKATGRAKYSYDINRTGMPHGAILRTPYAHSKKKDDKAAREETFTVQVTPSVTLIRDHKVVKLADLKQGDAITVDAEQAAVGRELYFAGDEVAAVAADTEEHAKDVLRAIKVEYDQLDHIMQAEDVIKEPKK